MLAGSSTCSAEEPSSSASLLYSQDPLAASSYLWISVYFISEYDKQLDSLLLIEIINKIKTLNLKLSISSEHITYMNERDQVGSAGSLTSYAPLATSEYIPEVLCRPWSLAWLYACAA